MDGASIVNSRYEHSSISKSEGRKPSAPGAILAARSYFAIIKVEPNGGTQSHGGKPWKQTRKDPKDTPSRLSRQAARKKDSASETAITSSRFTSVLPSPRRSNRIPAGRSHFVIIKVQSRAIRSSQREPIKPRKEPFLSLGSSERGDRGRKGDEDRRVERVAPLEPSASRREEVQGSG
ncbi:hypothetical protein KM043_002155 [Ampulex compressa]|nr:hypothetical protein KM043_002155 [Ampulex compressa]